MSTPLAFLDTETTGLDPLAHEAWEVAIIRRDERDEEHVFRIEPDAFAEADPDALRINRYFERVQSSGWRWDDRGAAARRIHELLAGVVVVGSNPGFDIEMIGVLLAPHGPARPAHYRPVDVATLAAGYLYGSGRGAQAPVPYSSRDLSRAVGVEPPGDGVAHTALGDARWCKAIFDAVTGGGR